MQVIKLIPIAILLVTASCSTSKNTITYSVPDVEVADEDLSSQIVVLNFDILKRKNNKSEVALKNTELIPGKLAESVIIYPPRELGKLVVHLLDDKGVIIEELVIKKPYLQILEEYDSDKEAALQNDDVEQHQFSIRFNENKEVKSIKIFKLLESGTVQIFHDNIDQL